MTSIPFCGICHCHILSLNSPARIISNHLGMKKIVIVAAVLLSGLCAFAQSFERPFVETRHNPVTNKDKICRGTATYTAPDQFALVYSDPEGEYVVIDGNTVRVDMAGQIATIDTRKNNFMGGMMETLMDCIAGRYEDAARRNSADVSVSDIKGGIRKVVLTARKAAVRGYSSIDLLYSKSDNFLTEMVLREFTGVQTTYKLLD